VILTERVLTSWALDEIAPEVALEELHTAFELLLTRAARKRRAPTFAELVKLAHEGGWLLGYSGRSWLDLDWKMAGLWTEPAGALSEHDLLISLKDQRRQSKHHGHEGAGDWLSVHFVAATNLLERLSQSMP
jgi:hypothetical protein